MGSVPLIQSAVSEPAPLTPGESVTHRRLLEQWKAEFLPRVILLPQLASGE